MSLLLLFNQPATVTITGTITASGEGFSDAVGDARESGTIAASSEGFVDALGAVRITGTLDASGEGSVDAVGTVTTSEPETPPVPSGRGGRRDWFGPTHRITGKRINATSIASVDAVGGVRLRGTVAGGSSASVAAFGSVRIPGRLTAAGSASAQAVGDVKDGDDDEITMILSAYLEYIDADAALELV